MKANLPVIESEDLAGHFLTFRVAHQRFALPLEQVGRVLRMVALIPVPEAPKVIAGLINIHGKVIPVISLRSRLGLAGRCAEVNDRIMVIKSRDRTLGLIVESVEAVLAVTADQVEPPRGSLVKAPLLQSVIQNGDDIYLVLSADYLDPEDFNSNYEGYPGGSEKQ